MKDEQRGKHTVSDIDDRPPKPREFQALLDQQPYEVEMNGLSVTVGVDVFPPDFGKSATLMADITCRLKPEAVLEVGCGTGFIAMRARQGGAAEVWATDIHPPAVECARRNVAANPELGPVHVVEGDLFSAIPKDLRFELIVFNQPYSPARSTPRLGCGADGGAVIVRRFLEEAVSHLDDEGTVMMSFCDRNDAEHDPAPIASSLGYDVEVLEHYDSYGLGNFIYGMKRWKSADRTSNRP